MGFFITFEGVEGCGKTTQIRLLDQRLRAVGCVPVVTREPGGCPISDQIRAILLDADNRAMTPMAELLLYAAARAQHVQEVILPGLAGDGLVLCDRFSDATLAYQSGGRGLDASVIRALNDRACGDLKPHLTILLDCDPAIGLERARQRIAAATGPKEERFELEALAFHQRVRESYLATAASEPTRILMFDATRSPDYLAEEISRVVLQRLERQ